MNGMRSLNSATNSQSQTSRKRPGSSILEIDSWMPSKIQAISPVVKRLMGLIERLQCVPGAEFDVEVAIREALGNAVVHGNNEDPLKKVHIRCRCEAGGEVSVMVSDQGSGFDFPKILGNGLASNAGAAYGHGIELMKAYMDDVHFERGGSEVHMRKRLRATACS